MKGKALTVAQRNLLSKNGVKDSTPWRYLKTITTDSNGKCASRNSSKVIQLVFVNTVTGEEKIIKEGIA